MTLRIGDELPDLPLLTPSGDEVRLRALRGEAEALIFLRHLA